MSRCSLTKLKNYLNKLLNNRFPQSLDTGGYVVVPEKLPNYVVPDLTDFKVIFLNIFSFFSFQIHA